MVDDWGSKNCEVYWRAPDDERRAAQGEPAPVKASVRLSQCDVAEKHTDKELGSLWTWTGVKNALRRVWLGHERTRNIRDALDATRRPVAFQLCPSHPSLACSASAYIFLLPYIYAIPYFHQHIPTTTKPNKMAQRVQRSFGEYIPEPMDDEIEYGGVRCIYSTSRRSITLDKHCLVLRRAREHRRRR